MNSRYLFKAKRIDNGEWVEGSLIDSGNHYQVFIYPHDDSASTMSCKTLVYHGMVAVDSNTICQYTGLFDKNGKKIWENDIVKVSERGVEISGGFIAFFNDYPGGWLITNKTMEAKCCLSRRNDVEVIGNIFDNQELLKGGAE